MPYGLSKGGAMRHRRFPVARRVSKACDGDGGDALANSNVHLHMHYAPATAAPATAAATPWPPPQPRPIRHNDDLVLLFAFLGGVALTLLFQQTL